MKRTGLPTERVRRSYGTKRRRNGRREENRGPERASESEEIDRTLEQIMDNQKQEKKKQARKEKWILGSGDSRFGDL